MKTFFVCALVIFASSSSFATNLKCKINSDVIYSDGKFNEVKFMDVEDQDNVSSDLPDQSTTFPFTAEEGLTTASFSNECDNDYGVAFPTREFDRLLKGKVKTIKGELTVANKGGTVDNLKIRCQKF